MSALHWEPGGPAHTLTDSACCASCVLRVWTLERVFGKAAWGRDQGSKLSTNLATPAAAVRLVYADETSACIYQFTVGSQESPSTH
jgi:hypothetical protein